MIALVEALYLFITQQQEQTTQLHAWVTALEDRSATNSRNHSKPSSSEGVVKQTCSLCQPLQRKPDGQPGHSSATLQQVAEPGQSVQHAPAQCTAYGTALSEVAGRLGEERRQVFELAPLKLVVTEHRVVIKASPACRQKNAGAFPEGASCGTSYGARVKSLLALLNQEHLVPSERSCQILDGLFGQPVSEGTLQAAVNGCAAALLRPKCASSKGSSM